ncbi:putative HTH-type transcriptional regulator [Paenibacillus polymyxa E681]|uniref:TetR/AcrR family transcriptional regulator n=1 Tax=Paenibacillus polymyxa TaxID=1406 RepID=UPI0001E31111|nr:TetR/AcrR family transcriptional regulator [Paenibacillus polymyxa]ADM69446.1 transcriptional regulator [Paenibacillus polymyxa E681]QNV56461.1 putative HTH-type transcriptional regulator [Paenibacillus polymyxa E681]QNV61298.1 putative HTH-type transcriptional regulator [Paenibacillus polymyxa E681]
MPYPKGHKMKVRSKIVESAAQAFRANGIHDVSVPFIMKGAGLTHGGFYSHFDNKEQLVAETCRYAVSDTLALLQEAIDQEKQASKINVVIDYYLSTHHRDRTEIGCIIPALSVEIARSSEEIRQIFTQELERMITFISNLAGMDLSKSSALFSSMVGSLVLARSVNDPKLSDSLLSAGKQYAKALVNS